MLIIKGEPQLEYCRDGGSIGVQYKSIFGGSFLPSLPIVRSGNTKETAKPSGYGFPNLIQYKKVKKISKATGKPYYLTKEKEIELTQNKALSIAQKIVSNANNQEIKNIGEQLVYAISTGGKIKGS